MRCLAQALRINSSLVQALQFRYSTVSLTAFRKKRLTYSLKHFLSEGKRLGKYISTLLNHRLTLKPSFFLKQLIFAAALFWLKEKDKRFKEPFWLPCTPFFWLKEKDKRFREPVNFFWLKEKRTSASNNVWLKEKGGSLKEP